MKKMVIAAGFLTAVVLVSGCRSTKVAGVTRSQEETDWEQVISRNYPGYRAPRAAAPAVVGNTEERESRTFAPKKPDAEVMPANEVNNSAEPKAEVVASEEVKAAEVKDAPAVAPDAEAEAKADVKTAPATPAAAPAAPEADAKKTVQPPDPTSGKVYVVKSGDTLGKIAVKYYGKASYSNLIFKANSDILKNPNQLRPGMKLIVPEL